MTTSGPVVFTSSTPWMGSTRKIWYRQAAPYVRPLPYTFDKMYRLSGTNGDPNSWSVNALDGSEWDVLDNKVLDKIKGQISESTAQWGSNLATWKQSHGMIVGRATQLLTAARQLRRGNFKAAGMTLGIKKIKPKTAQELSGQWLELSYGWLPLIQDIHNAVDVMQQPLPRIRLDARAGKVYPPVDYSIYESYQWTRRVRAGCTVSAVHNGTWLANSLGLVNPAVVLWEIVPFSFVVDWFLPIGRFLESFTDFVGVEIRDPFHTHFGEVTRDVHIYEYPPNSWSCRRVQVQRATSLPSYKLISRFTGFYSMRGANAIALLVGGLKDLSARHS